MTPLLKTSPEAALTRGVDRRLALALDYGQVPARVNKRQLTLRVSVGACERVLVTADGVPIPARLEATGSVVFTTSGRSITVTAVNWTHGVMGAVAKAALLDDKRWAFSLTLDDAIQSQWDNAKPLLDAKGWRAGLAVFSEGPDNGDPWNMTWAEIQALVDAGWDVYNHSYSHPVLTPANALAELGRNQATLEARLPGYHVTRLVHPFADMSVGGAELLPAQLLSAEGGGDGFNLVDAPLAPGFIAQRAAFQGTDAGEALALAAAAAASTRPAWLINIIHGVAPDNGAPADAYSTNAAALAALLNHLHGSHGPRGDNSLWFAPSGEVMDYLLTRDAVTVRTLPA